MINCNYCSLSFLNKAQLKNHVRSNHQSSVVVSFNGQSKSVNRESNNLFHCPRCNQDYKNPRSIHRHAACFFDQSPVVPSSALEFCDQSPSDDAILTNFDTPQDEPSIDNPVLDSISAIDEYLSRRYLAYDSNNKVMICTQCRTILNDNYVDHARVHHSKIVEQALVDTIENFLPTSLFQTTLDFPIPALPFVQVLTGYQCPTCHWCCTLKRSMAEHYSKSHPNNSYVNVNLQSISRGCCLKFFPVVPPVREDTNSIDHEEVARIVESVSSLARAPSLLPENDKTRNILFTKTGWFTDEQEFEDLRQLDIHSYFECPGIFDQWKINVERYFEEALQSVGSWDVIHRMDLGRIDKGKPLLSLKTIEARKKYASYWCSLVYFALNVCSQRSSKDT